MHFLSIPFLSRSRALFLTLAALFCLAGAAHAQKVDKEKLDTGTKRAAKAAKVINDLTALPAGESIPRDILAKARVIAIFPDVTKINILFQKAMKGYGLAARRTDTGWGTPAFYGFGVSDKGWTRVKSQSPGLIMLFMGESSAKAFEKDHIAIAGAAEGPIGGSVSEQVLKNISNEGILVYALSDGKLAGVSIADDDTALSALGIDNNINKAVFGLKGNDVFWGKSPLPSALASDIADFQKALTAFANPEKTSATSGDR